MPRRSSGPPSEAIEQIDGRDRDLRNLITELRPAALDELGAGAGARGAHRPYRAADRPDASTPEIDLAYEAGREPQRHEPEIEAAIYRLVQEALTNVVKHAGDVAVHVAVAETADAVTDPRARRGPWFMPDARHEGFGLLGMRERVELVGGTLSVQSTPGAGTTLDASLPVRRRTDAPPTQAGVAS